VEDGLNQTHPAQEWNGLSERPPGQEWDITNREFRTKYENDPAFKQRYDAAKAEHVAKLENDPVYRAQHISIWAMKHTVGRIQIEALLYQAAGADPVEIRGKVWRDANSADVPALKAVFKKYGYEMAANQPRGNVFARKRVT
jgi:hypothetical protein